MIDGSLNLTNVAHAQKHFQNEFKNGNPLGVAEKKEILKTLENKSTREAERELLSRSSNPIQLIGDKIKAVTETSSEIRFIADNHLLEKLNQVKALLAHKNPNPTMAELVAEMAHMTLIELKKRKYKVSKVSDVSEVPEVRQNKDRTIFGPKQKQDTSKTSFTTGGEQIVDPTKFQSATCKKQNLGPMQAQFITGGEQNGEFQNSFRTKKAQWLYSLSFSKHTKL